MRRARRFLFVTIGFTIVIVLALAWTSTVISAFVLTPFISFLAPLVSWIPALTFVSLLIFIGVPLFFLLIWLMRTLFGTYIHGNLATNLTIAWIFSFVGLALSGWLTLKEFQAKTHQPLYHHSVWLTTDTIDIELDAWPEATKELLGLKFDNILSYREGNLYLGQVSISIMPSTDDSLRVLVEAEAHGADSRSARRYISNLHYPFEVHSHKVRLSPWFGLKEGQKWRAQRVNVVVYVPAGKYVRMRALEGAPHQMIDFYPPVARVKRIQLRTRPIVQYMGPTLPKDDKPTLGEH